MKILLLLLSAPFAMASPLTDWFVDQETKVPRITEALTKEKAQNSRGESLASLS
ncbi:MAG: hypothetical protein ACJAQT_001830 [Akkermansiaceae bacterium]|jgi:hypothetical protein